MPLSNDKLWFPIDSSRPLSDQVYEGLRERILDGRLAGGSRVPSTRAIATELGVSRTTTQRAYEQLLAEGYITTRHGSGTFVSPELPDDSMIIVEQQSANASATPILSCYGTRVADGDLGNPYRVLERMQPARYEFLYGLVDAFGFPQTEWQRCIASCARAWSMRSYAYGPAQGSDELRRAITEHLDCARGVRCHSDQVVIVSGIQQGIQLISRLFVDPGDGVLLEEPHYLGARHTFLAEGARIARAPVDGDGLDIDAVPRRQLAGCKLCFVTPSHQFPLGCVLSVARRLKLLAWANDADAFIIEDDYDSEFRYDGKPVETLFSLDRSGRVIYAGTFSKTMFPSLRIAYLVLPEPLVDVVCGSRWLSGWANPTLEQDALCQFIKSGHYRRHLHRSRKRYARRRAALLDALHRHFGKRITVAGAMAGLHLIAWLPELTNADLEPLITQARKRNVGIYPITPCYLGSAPGAGLILGYTILNEEAIAEGIEQLRRAY